MGGEGGDAAVVLVVPRGQGEQHRARVDGAGQVVQEVEGVGVGPVQVVEHEHGAPVAVELGEQREDPLAEHDGGVGARPGGRVDGTVHRARDQPRERGPERPQPRRLRERSGAQRRREGLGEGPVRAAAGHRAAAQHREPGGAGGVGDLTEQP